ncbi:hypothetical protein [Pseudonocardia hydrocarbonoxydans]|uniref:Uncharacterized protein n=1 Tax=Pseudonocardia hydrocarbonoxydans TaxID=76726 RepID=A0A4Y3WTY8_9PSEU|nr:hypothetical protein [Pseudonocardia hydrocarbonoxydans]GEC22303.1 hypothetical protein PHY01_45860 [Pseudonocardia hydrocarbonoxydans]
MTGFVAQVWVLCAVAFLLGAGVTWLLFVRPQRHQPVPVAAPAPVAPPALPRRVVRPPAPPAVDPGAPPADPALAALDGPAVAPSRWSSTGARASDALDRLGVTPSGLAPAIPTQPGPADEDEPRA